MPEHIFATWLHREGVSLYVLRPLLGNELRSTTDRYAYLDIKTIGKVVNLMPIIRRENQKKWQELARLVERPYPNLATYLHKSL